MYIFKHHVHICEQGRNREAVGPLGRFKGGALSWNSYFQDWRNREAVVGPLEMAEGRGPLSPGTLPVTPLFVNLPHSPSTVPPHKCVVWPMGVTSSDVSANGRVRNKPMKMQKSWTTSVKATAYIPPKKVYPTAISADTITESVILMLRITWNKKKRVSWDCLSILISNFLSNFLDLIILFVVSR